MLKSIVLFSNHSDFIDRILDESIPTSAETVMMLRYSPSDGIFDMAVEIVIQRSLEYARSRKWDRQRQDELAACTVRKVRPDWSEIEALCAVDWVRSLAQVEIGGNMAFPEISQRIGGCRSVNQHVTN